MALKALILCAVSVTAAHSVAPIQQAADGRLLPAASAASVHRHRHEADSNGSSSSSLLKALSFSVINLFASTTEPVSTSVAACLHSLKNAMLAHQHKIDGWRDSAPLPQNILPKVATLHHFNIPLQYTTPRQQFLQRIAPPAFNPHPFTPDQTFNNSATS